MVWPKECAGITEESLPIDEDNAPVDFTDTSVLPQSPVNVESWSDAGEPDEPLTGEP